MIVGREVLWMPCQCLGSVVRKAWLLEQTNFLMCALICCTMHNPSGASETSCIGIKEIQNKKSTNDKKKRIYRRKTLICRTPNVTITSTCSDEKNKSRIFQGKSECCATIKRKWEISIFSKWNILNGNIKTCWIKKKQK